MRVKPCLRIFILEDGKEIEKRIYPRAYTKLSRTDWDNGTFLSNLAYNKVLKHLKVDELPDNVDYCWSSLSIPCICSDWPKEEKERIRNTQEYKDYKELWIKSQIVACTDSMFKDNYLWLHHACKHNGDEDMDDGITNLEYKDYLYLGYLFNEMLGWQKSRIDTGAWVFRDGSYLTVDTAQHRRLVEEYMGKKEFDMERWWVKVSLYRVYTHNHMTNEQWETICKFTKKYRLSEYKVEYNARIF